MTVSLLANEAKRAELAEAEAAGAKAEAASLRQRLERALALADAWDHHQSAHVRTAAASLRTVIAQPREGK